jgi:hypothetical protein
MDRNGARGLVANSIQLRQECTLEKLILLREIFYRHAKCGGNVYSVAEMQKNEQTHTLLYRNNRSATMLHILIYCLKLTALDTV